MRRGLAERGIYLLELTGATVGVMLFSLALIDLAGIYRTRAALSASLNTGLRCLFPWDGQCMSGVQGAKRYTSWVTPSDTKDLNTYSVYRETASASWYSVPRKAFESELIEVKEVKYRRPFRRYLELIKRTPIFAEVSYLVQVTGLPRLSGEDPLAPEFVSKSKVDKIIFDISKTRLFSESNNSVEIPIFISSELDRSATGLPCFKLNPIKNGAISVVPPEPCIVSKGDGELVSREYSLDAARQAFLHIAGEVENSDEQAEGKVEISLLNNIGRERDLGGRLISYGSSGSFVTRGVAREDVNNFPSYTEHGYDREVNTHAGLVVPLDREFLLRLNLNSLNKKAIGWHGKTATIFIPRFERRGARIKCDEDCKNIPSWLPVVEKKLDSAAEAQTVQVIDLGCSAKPPTIDSLKRPRVLQIGEFLEVIETEASSEECVSQIRSAACPADAKTHSIKGCGAVPLRSELMEICPPPQESDEVVSWEFGKSAGDGGQVISTGYCDALGAPLPSQCKGIVEGEDYVGVLETGDNRKSMCFGSDLHSHALSLIVSDSSCTPSPPNISSEFVSYFNPPIGVQVSVKREKIGEEVRKKNQACGRGNDATPHTEYLCSQGVSYLEAKKCCAQVGGKCRIVEEPPKTGEAPQGPDFSMASALAMDSMKILAPAASLPCEGAPSTPCSKFSFWQDNSGRMYGSAEASLRLNVLKLGDPDFLIKVQEDRMSERARNR